MYIEASYFIRAQRHFLIERHLLHFLFILHFLSVFVYTICLFSRDEWELQMMIFSVYFFI